jgi:hypothetical protein
MSTDVGVDSINWCDPENIGTSARIAFVYSLGRYIQLFLLWQPHSITLVDSITDMTTLLSTINF